MAIQDTKDKQYDELLPVWAQTRAAIRGKPGAIELVKADKYFGIVTPNYRITTDNYAELTKREEQYFGRGRFFAATGNTHDAFVGMIGSVLPEVKLPPEIEGMRDNIDGENGSINDALLEITSELLVTARYGVLSDAPDMSGKTNAQAKNDLPRLIPYKAEQIPYARVDKGVVQEVRLYESYWKQVTDTEWEQHPQLRRLYLDADGYYTSEIWREAELFSSVQPEINSKRMEYIPFQFYGSENNKPSYDRPVMFDLAHQNLGHFMLDCDNRDNLHYHGQGMTNIYTKDADAIKENNPGGIDVGAKGKNIWGVDDRVEILQIEATGALPAEMLRDEQRMIMLGAQVVQNTSGNQTLGAKEIETNASTSQIKRVTINAGEGLTQNLKWCAEMMGGNPDDVMVKPNTKFFTDKLTAQDVQAVFAGIQGGLLPDDLFLEAVRKAGYTDKTDDEIKDIIEDQGQGDSEQVAQLTLLVEQLTEKVNSMGGSDE